MPNQAQQKRVKGYLWRVGEVAALLALVVVVCVVFAWSIHYVLPFIIGWFLAVLLLPIVKLLERKGLSRKASAAAVLASVIVVVVIASVYTIVAIAREATQLSSNIGTYYDDVRDWIQHQITVGQNLFSYLPPKVATGMEDTLLQQLSSLEAIFKAFAGSLLASVTNLPDAAFVVVIALIATFFMLVNRERMYESFLGALPPGWSDKLQVVISDMLRAFVGTIRVQVVLMVMSAVLGVIGLVVMGIPYAVIMGLLIGLTGIIPIVGSAILTIPWAAGAFVLGDPALAIKLLLLQVVISLIRHIVEPKILADSVGLDTLSTLFGLYVGMQFIGVWGLFLGPVILIGLKSLLRTRLFRDFFPQSDDEEMSGSDHPNSRTDSPLNMHSHSVNTAHPTNTSPAAITQSSNQSPEVDA